MGANTSTWGMCQENDWHVGTILTGSEGDTVTTIEIMYLSPQILIAKDLDTLRENRWTLLNRDWKEV